MAHELTQRSSGLVEMAYVGGQPWHGLGQELAAGADIGKWTEQAGMDWLVKRSRVRFGEGASQQTWDKHHVLFRSDTKAPLGVVGQDYKIVQPRECLEFFRDLVGEYGFELNTAGTLFGGRKFWALASIGESACIIGTDKVGGYLLLTSSCDGTSSTTAKFVVERVVCNNTLTMAMKEGGKVVSTSHRTAFKPEQVQDRLGIVRGAFSGFVQASRALASREVSQMRAAEMTEALLTATKTVTREDVTDSAGFRSIMQLFATGKGNNGKTAWDWVNGVTEYVDHVQRAKSESHRLANVWFGKGDALKSAAMTQALELIA